MDHRECTCTTAKEEVGRHSLGKVTRHLGVSTFASLALTALVRVRKFKCISPKVHVALGIHTLILATMHAAVAIYAYRKKHKKYPPYERINSNSGLVEKQGSGLHSAQKTKM